MKQIKKIKKCNSITFVDKKEELQECKKIGDISDFFSKNNKKVVLDNSSGGGILPKTFFLARKTIVIWPNTTKLGNWTFPVNINSSKHRMVWHNTWTLFSL